jgi:hypothetical protein
MIYIRDLLATCTGFEWDEGNIDKNWIKHKVNYREIEQTIINRPAVFLEDSKHSHREERFSALASVGARQDRCEQMPSVVAGALGCVYHSRRPHSTDFGSGHGY